MLLRNKDSIPVFVKLCTEDQLMDALQNFSYRNLQLPAKKTPQTSNLDIYPVLMAPMEKYLAQAKTIYFSPDGLLHQLAFATIPCSNGKILMDRFQLVQLTSTRLVIDSSISTPGSAVLFGGIDYNHQTQGKIPAKPDAFDYVYQQNHRNIADSFVALHYTLDEIRQIAATLSTGERQVYTYTGSDASESNFRSACSTLTPSIIHFATHGFTLPDSMKYRKISNPYSASRNPLFRTGLVMAAGNKGWRNKTTLDEDDGILTGLEIASIPQTKTELAVLSACETANGEVRGSEGVFGLQRAFKLAGVKNVLASLWQVPDRETETFMVSFYRNWVSSKNVQIAFYRTQTDFRAKKIPLYYWAGFVLIK
jgi:CHAT domain-containing protein